MILIDDLCLLPLRGLIALFNTLYRHAATEAEDEQTLYRRLREARLRYELDEMDESDYLTEEQEILERLRAIRLQRLERQGALEDG